MKQSTLIYTANISEDTCNIVVIKLECKAEFMYPRVSKGFYTEHKFVILN